MYKHALNWFVHRLICMYSVWTCMYTIQHYIYMYKTEYYRQLGLCVPAIQHDQQWWIANARLARHIQIAVRKSKTLHLILIWRDRISCRMRVKFLEQGLVVLQVASTCMKTQDTHKNILIVRKVGHCFDVFDMCMLQKHTQRLKNGTRQVCKQSTHVCALFIQVNIKY